MPVTAILSQRLSQQLGEETASELVNWFNQVDFAIKAELRELNDYNFSRFDSRLEQGVAELRAEFRGEIAALRSEVRQDIAALRSEVRQEISSVRAELLTAHANLRAELIRWTFGTWATQMVTLVGVILTVVLTR